MVCPAAGFGTRFILRQIAPTGVLTGLPERVAPRGRQPKCRKIPFCWIRGGLAAEGARQRNETDEDRPEIEGGAEPKLQASHTHTMPVATSDADLGAGATLYYWKGRWPPHTNEGACIPNRPGFPRICVAPKTCERRLAHPPPPAAMYRVRSNGGPQPLQATPHKGQSRHSQPTTCRPKPSAVGRGASAGSGSPPCTSSTGTRCRGQG